MSSGGGKSDTVPTYDIASGFPASDVFSAKPVALVKVGDSGTIALTDKGKALSNQLSKARSQPIFVGTTIAGALIIGVMIVLMILNRRSLKDQK